MVDHLTHDLKIEGSYKTRAKMSMFIIIKWAAEIPTHDPKFECSIKPPQPPVACIIKLLRS